VLSFLLGALSLEICGALSLEICGALSLEICGAPTLLLGGAFPLQFGALSFELCRALAFEFCGVLALAFGGQLALAFGGVLALALGCALPGLLRGAFSLLPRAFLPLGAFFFPSGGALPLRGTPITVRAAVAPRGMILPCSKARRCVAVGQRAAIGLHAEAVGSGDRDRPGRGQAWHRRRIVICGRPGRGR
jgi:hypothetical protein